MDGKAHLADGPATSANGHIGYDSANLRAVIYETSDVLAIGGMYYANPYDTFGGITGTLGNMPTAGTASYTGDFGAVLQEGTVVYMYAGINGLTIDVDFEAAELVGSGNNGFELEGDIVGSEFTGTASLLGNTNAVTTTVPMQGGFYGTETVAGAFSGAGLAGVFGATQNP